MIKGSVQNSVQNPKVCSFLDKTPKPVKNGRARRAVFLAGFIKTAKRRKKGRFSAHFGGLRTFCAPCWRPLTARAAAVEVCKVCKVCCFKYLKRGLNGFFRFPPTRTVLQRSQNVHTCALCALLVFAAAAR